MKPLTITLFGSLLIVLFSASGRKNAQNQRRYLDIAEAQIENRISEPDGYRYGVSLAKDNRAGT